MVSAAVARWAEKALIDALQPRLNVQRPKPEPIEGAPWKELDELGELVPLC
jgi:hypothetical protein